MDDRGEITDDDRRVAAERSGLPEATVYGVSTFYDDLLTPRGERHVRVCTGTACFAATGDAHVDEMRDGARPRARRARGGRLGLPRRDRLPRLLPRRARPSATATSSMPGPGVVERLLAGARRVAAAEPDAGQRPRRAGADPARRLVGPARARWRPDARGAARGGQGGRRRAAAAAPASRPGRSGSSRARPTATRSSSSPTATRATPAPTSTRS